MQISHTEMLKAVGEDLLEKHVKMVNPNTGMPEEQKSSYQAVLAE